MGNVVDLQDRTTIYNVNENREKTFIGKPKNKIK